MPDHTPLAALESSLSRYEAIPPAPEDAPSYVKVQHDARRTRALLEFTAHCTPETVRGLIESARKRDQEVMAACAELRQEIEQKEQAQ